MRLPVALSLALLTAGCGETLEKVPVQGEVTFNGQKVINGDIRLVPEEGTTGAVRTAPIVDGQFLIDGKGGVPVGEHRVILRAFIVEGLGAAVGGSAPTDLLSAGQGTSGDKPSVPVYVFEGRKQFLPPEYNARPGLTITVTGEQNPQIEDFNLRSDES